MRTFLRWCTVRLPTVGTALRAGNAAELISLWSSRCAGCAWRQAASLQRPSLTTTRRIEGTTTHSGSARSAAYAPNATTGSTPTMARARRCARMAPLPTRTTTGTGQAKGVSSLTRRAQCRFVVQKMRSPLLSIRRIAQSRGHSCADPRLSRRFCCVNSVGPFLHADAHPPE